MYMDLPVSFVEAALVRRLMSPPFMKQLSLKFLKEHKWGLILDCGSGIARLGGSGNGDQYVKITIIPKNLTEKQRRF